MTDRRERKTARQAKSQNPFNLDPLKQKAVNEGKVLLLLVDSFLEQNKEALPNCELRLPGWKT